MAKTVEDISTLKINILSQAQYEAEVAGGTVAEDELYFTPSLGSGVSDVEVDGESVVSGGVAQIIMPVVPEKVSDLINDLGFLTSETDPTVPAWAKVPVKPSYNFSEINSTPTTLSGYGITDAKIANGTITLGNNTITPLTSFTETDPTVPAWAKQVNKPSYTASEVGALPDTTPIPSKTSDLTNDSGFITGVTSTSVPTANTIAEWDNDVHMNSEDMTSQEVDDFVDSLNVSGINAVDYVVEEGTNNNWDYRKWNSGVAECWKTWSGSGATDGSVLGGYYKKIELSFPTGLFNSTPLYGFSSGKMGTGVSMVTARELSADKILTYILTNQSGTLNIVVRVYVKGTWK